jgi:hypothetical protein
MTFDEVMIAFDAVQSDSIRTVLNRRSPSAKVYGVRFGDIDKIAKKIKRDSDLALQLWDTGYMEARELACRIVDPAVLTESQVEKLASEVDYPVTADSYAKVVYKTPFRAAKLAEWTKSDRDFVRRIGFCLLFDSAADPKNDISDKALIGYLGRIKDEIHASPNWSREMMNMVPISIGLRNANLFPIALETAKAYGKVDVFHGDKTNCKIWNAVDALQDPKTKVKPPA